LLHLTSEPAEDTASNNLESQQTTIQATESEESTDEVGDITTPELIEKAVKTRDRLNLHFARHSINSGNNHEVLIMLAESALALDSMARVLAEKQGHVELLTRELFLEKLNRRAREEELVRARATGQRGAAAASAAPVLPVEANFEGVAAFIVAAEAAELDFEIVAPQVQGQVAVDQAEPRQERLRRRRWRLFRG
jgi:hypothetical protein